MKKTMAIAAAALALSACTANRTIPEAQPGTAVFTLSLIHISEPTRPY